MELEKIFEIVKIKQVTVESEREKRIIRSPEDAADIFMEEIGDEDREVFMVLCLNTKNQVVAMHRCHMGSINASIVHPRETFKSAILNNSASIIVGHNHPSADTNPSQEDVQITRRLVEAGKMLNIEVLDHLIVGEHRYTSLKEQNHI